MAAQGREETEYGSRARTGRQAGKASVRGQMTTNGASSVMAMEATRIPGREA